jgi:hypothetical protein
MVPICVLFDINSALYRDECYRADVAAATETNLSFSGRQEWLDGDDR